MDALWTVDDRIEYAEGIRGILLDPKGAQRFARKQEYLKDFYRQEREKRMERQAFRDTRAGRP